MQLQKNHKIALILLTLGLSATIASPIIAKQIWNGQGSSLEYIHIPLIKQKQKINSNLETITKNYQNKIPQIEAKIKQLINSKQTQDDKLLQINNSLNTTTSLKIKIQNLIRAYRQFLINPTSIHDYLSSKYQSIFDALKVENWADNQTKLALTPDLQEQVNNLQKQLITYLETFKLKSQNANELISNNKDNKILEFHLHNDLDAITFNAQNYFNEYHSIFLQFNKITKDNFRNFLIAFDTFFESVEEQISKLNSSLNLYIEALVQKENLITEKIKDLSLQKDLFFNSIEILQKYLQENKQTYELIKLDSDYLGSIIENQKLTNINKELVYKSFLHAYALKFDTLSSSFLNYLTSILELEINLPEFISKVQNLKNQTLEIRNNNQELINLAHSDLKNIKVQQNIGEIFKNIFNLNINLIDNILNLIENQTNELSFLNDEKQRLFGEVEIQNSKIDQINLVLINSQNEILTLNSKISKIEKSIHKAQTQNLVEEIANLSSKLKSLNKEKQKVALVQKEQEQEKNIIQNQYNQLTNKLIKLISISEQKLIILKHMNLSLSILFQENTTNNNLIETLRLKVQELTNLNAENKKIKENLVKEHKLEVTKFENKIQSLILETKLKNEKLNSYKLEISNINNQIDSLNIANRNLTSNIEILNLEINKYQDKINQQKLQIQDKETEIAKLEAKILNQQNKIQNYETQLIDLRNSNPENDSKIMAIKQELNQAKLTIENLKNSKAQMQEIILEWQAKLEKEKIQNQAIISKLNEKLNDQNEKLKLVKLELNKSEEIKNNLLAQLSVAEKEISNLKIQLETKENEKQKLMSLLKEKESLNETEKAKLNTIINELSKEKEKLTSEIASLEANRTIEDKKKDDLIKTLGYQNQTLKLELEKLNQNFNNNFVPWVSKLEALFYTFYLITYIHSI
ncbi:Uncharacterised protein (plasmid) [Mycoplasmopsis gallopavonis]|uniref:Uncharacterized protein n=1 Tax=Mycoplasmopsis gallopavonis TaxID=76629 RepID=A0A449AZX7_9BACT|nr:hypothetical protein [Mycoplasmopsis gallopavonis]VEU73099.1 Uncharacterised protein [Mycoplasmopsis gallopavonis]